MARCSPSRPACARRLTPPSVYNGINAAIDRYIAEKKIEAPPPSTYRPVWESTEEPLSLDLEQAGISSIIWCIGYRPDFGWLEPTVFNGAGHPKHYRGVTAQLGLYFLGLPWLYTWGSGRFSGIARDARYLAEHIEESRRMPDAGARRLVATG
jgi:putative flavoprotein involved in K+ transport